MKSALYNTVNWEEVEYIGFDMDGTLYDEYEFIKQPYLEISKMFDEKEVFTYMTNRWIEKGSSYNKIFDETYDLYSHTLLTKHTKEEFISITLDIFRNFSPKLALSSRVEYLLNFFKQKYKLFLITDGNINLQTKKFKALELHNYFEDKNVVFTGQDTKYLAKPSINSIKLLNIIPEKSIFFGDRNKDEQFAQNANMQYQKVYNMIEVQK
jgi:FMN phosphatase YigB (HAD superfamily)